MDELIVANKIIAEYRSNADFVGVRIQKKFSNMSDVRDGKLDVAGFGEDFGLMLEVMMDGYIAYAATSSFDDESIKQAFNKARQYCLLQKEWGIYKFLKPIRGNKKLNFKTSKNSFQTPDIPEAIEAFKKITIDAKKNPNIQSAKAHLNFYNHSILYVNSLGAEVMQDLDFYYIKSMVVASKSGESQSRSLEHMSSADKIDIKSINDFPIISMQVNELLNARNCPVGKKDLIITPDQLFLQVHESIGHPLELDRILGDERNYAGWSFVGLEDFGKLQYGSKLLNVTFDPSVQGEIATYAADETGMSAKKEYLIKDGILMAGIGGIESQERSGVKGITSQRSTSWNRAPIDRMGNINIEAGSASLKHMIANTEDGILMQTNKSWSIDDYRNKFQFGCEYAQIIREGELKEVVRNPNYRGISVPFWKSLKMVGDQSTMQIYGAVNCGKGEPNQIINVGHATPTCLFEKVDVFGGDS